VVSKKSQKSKKLPQAKFCGSSLMTFPKAVADELGLTVDDYFIVQVEGRRILLLPVDEFAKYQAERRRAKG
jgi:antitoxin component of MazEF toxin-antitoxin module